MKRISFLFLAHLLVVGSLGPATAGAEVPELINYQARLVEGANLVNGAQPILFTLYNTESGGTPLYQETQTVNIVDGLYAAAIGASNDAPGALSSVLTNEEVYLEVTVDGETLSPRERLMAVPYARVVHGLRVIGNGGVLLNAAEGENVMHASADHAAIGGGTNNIIRSSAVYAAISGGRRNRIMPGANGSAIGGGGDNIVQTNVSFATIGGGVFNVIKRDSSTIGGGFDNIVDSFYAAIGGGQFNEAAGIYATVGGGQSNEANGEGATIPGGSDNDAWGDFSFAAGRDARALHDGSFVWSDSSTTPFLSVTNDEFAVRAAGGLRLAGGAFIGDGAGLTNLAGGAIATNTISTAQLANDAVKTDELADETVTPAKLDRAYAEAGDVWLLDGNTNTFPSSFIGTIDNNSFEVRVNNAPALRIDPIGGAPIIVGGHEANSANSSGAVIGGGGSATSPNTISAASWGTIGGGVRNTVSGHAGTVAGGDNNQVDASWSTIPGGRGNEANGQYAFAAGRRAHAEHTGAFVWADSEMADFSSTDDDQFLVRAAGGVGINTPEPLGALQVLGSSTGATMTVAPDALQNADVQIILGEGRDAELGAVIKYDGDDNDLQIFGREGGTNIGPHMVMTRTLGRIGFGTVPSHPLHMASGAHVTSGGTWTDASSRDRKENLETVDGADVLARLAQLDIRRWNYKVESDELRHMGPMAEDFHALFGLGMPKGISGVDRAGVAFVAIQELKRRNDALRADKEELENRLERLEQRLRTLEDRPL